MPNEPRIDTLASDSDQAGSDSRNGESSRPVAGAERGRVKSLQIRQDRITVSYSGPLPPPSMLAGYEETLVGSAERIVRQAEEVSEHRRSLESTMVNSNVRLEASGQVFAFVIAMTGLVGGIGLAAFGKPIPGAATAIIALGAVAGMFVWAKRKQEREPTQSRSAVQGNVQRDLHEQADEP